MLCGSGKDSAGDGREQTVKQGQGDGREERVVMRGSTEICMKMS